MALLALLIATPASAQTFPALSGRVLDQANIIPPDQEAALTQKLEQLERQTSRQLVVATIASLEGYEISDYGYRLGRQWRIGAAQANNGALLIIAPNERRVRVEVGYGLEGILTDAFSGQIIREQMTPRFRQNDYPGGINAGVDAIIAQLQAPPEAAEQAVLAAAQSQRSRSNGGGGAPIELFIGLFILALFLIPGFFWSRRGGRRYRSRRGGIGPVVIWGPGWSGGGGSGGGFFDGGGGGGDWGGGGGGGFSGGGGSFGGGGASGDW